VGRREIRREGRGRKKGERGAGKERRRGRGGRKREERGEKGGREGKGRSPQQHFLKVSDSAPMVAWSVHL